MKLVPHLCSLVLLLLTAFSPPAVIATAEEAEVCEESEAVQVHACTIHAASRHHLPRHGPLHAGPPGRTRLQYTHPPFPPSPSSLQAIKARIETEEAKSSEAKDYVLLKQLTIELYGQRAIDEERQRIETAMHEAGDSQDLSTAASLQKEIRAWDEAVQSARGKQWDGEALHHAATEADLAGVLGAIMQGASADDHTGEVSSLVRVNNGGLVDALSLPPPAMKHACGPLRRPVVP